MTEDEGLFPMPDRMRPLGKTARRTRRSKFMISMGIHPLTAPSRKILPVKTPTWPAPPAETCGGCRWLEPLDRDVPPSRTVYKCWFNGGARVTRGAATTVRKSWPACVDFEEANGPETATQPTEPPAE